MNQTLVGQNITCKCNGKRKEYPNIENIILTAVRLPALIWHFDLLVCFHFYVNFFQTLWLCNVMWYNSIYKHIQCLLSFSLGEAQMASHYYKTSLMANDRRYFVQKNGLFEHNYVSCEFPNISFSALFTRRNTISPWLKLIKYGGCTYEMRRYISFAIGWKDKIILSQSFVLVKFKNIINSTSTKKTNKVSPTVHVN